ncbi:autophagocytosis associated protein Atg3, N-terminal domain containing protein [Nitzschia inconspicua]|uniref:Autophagocytosis associated protein Atg3, N-terminal domain containing protein n=1 Tax=Nitzschia inconspicua TaxID=303405 RepID=A0A9K3LJW3_9STRA|nr:autophagocytosis associated protein Atg3, N-terminal domain containing protein [Nitzschia inconspicua]
MSSVLGSLRRAREWAYPQRTTSAFLEKGVLTPEEFVQAGDELVYRCPTWQWEAGEESQRKSYLPPDKQYLITRNVPCQNRVSAMETNMAMEDGTDGDDDWLVSSILERKDDEDDDDFDILDSDGEIMEKPQTAPVEEIPIGSKKEEDDEYADMADFEDNDVLTDDDAAAVVAQDTNSHNVLKVRTYDISITYDKYYQTPRVWMIGRNESNQQPLTAQEMMQDVISDYANKTVTMEPHPHVSGPQASIHPCQHGKVMKAIVRNLIKATDKQKLAQDEGDNEAAAQQQGPSVEMYLFIFLKFVSSMIPTINYDFTMDVTADTSK